MFDQLALDEEDFHDFVIEEDDAALEESTRWMVATQVFMNKKFSHHALLQQMQNAWNLVREISIRTVSDDKICGALLLFRRLGESRGKCHIVIQRVGS
jgi:hypothetical protein